MRKRPITRALLLLLATAIGLVGCAALPQTAVPAETEATQANTLEVETMDFSHETENVIYLAGGCFWGLEQLMQSIPGVLKNLLDWLSRPLVPNDWERGSVMKGKPVTISGVAGRSGAAGVRKHLSALLEVMSMNLIGGMGTGISADAQSFATNELHLSEETYEALQAQAELFLSQIL